MKNILTFLVFIIFISCDNNGHNDYDDNNSFENIEPITTMAFAVDKSSDVYKLFLDKKGKIKKNIGIIVGKRKFIFDKILEIKSNQRVDYNSYFYVLSKFEGKNRSFIVFYSTEGNEHSDILSYVIEETGNPFYITVDKEKKFEIIVPKRPTGYANGDVKENAVTVNGKESKLLISDHAIIILK